MWNGSCRRPRYGGGQTHCGFRMGLLHGWLWKWFLSILPQRLFLFSEGEWKSQGYLQITDLYLLRGRDCKRMCRFNQVEQFLGLSEGGQLPEKAGHRNAGGFFRPISLLFSFVPVKRFRKDRIHCFSPTPRKAVPWLSKRVAPWRTGIQHIFRWAQKEI